MVSTDGLVAPWLKQCVAIRAWGESCCFGECCSESVTFIWFCQERKASSVHDTYCALLEASWEALTKFSTWFRHVGHVGKWVQELQWMCDNWLGIWPSDERPCHSPLGERACTWVCGALDTMHIWASQYSMVVCVCAHTLERCLVYFVFPPVCVCAGPHTCVAIWGAVAKTHCETAALVYLSLKISLCFLVLFYLARYFQWLWKEASSERKTVYGNVAGSVVLWLHYFSCLLWSTKSVWVDLLLSRGKTCQC